MSNLIDLVTLMRELAEIASTTTDPETASRLSVLIEKLMHAAGLPPGNA